MPFTATWMDQKIAMLSEVSQTERNVLWHVLYVESKKKWYRWSYLQSRDWKTWRTNLWLLGGRMEGRTGWEFWDGHDTLLCLKWISGRDLLWSTSNSAQWYGAAWMVGEFGESGYVRQVYAPWFLSPYNKDLEWWTLKPPRRVTALGSWTDHVIALRSRTDSVIALRQISVTAQCYSFILFR